MNRELKFRVWDKLEKEWCSFHPQICSGGVKGAFVFSGSQYQRKNLVIQQYTGMIDRNGVEVYEGDIVAEKITEEMAANGDSATVGVVYFAAGTFLIDGDGALYERVFSDSPHILEDFIVIGNIFENSELLN